MKPPYPRHIVIAMNEELELHRLVKVDARRFEVLRQLTREEFQAKRAENARVRKAVGLGFADGVSSASGEGLMTLKAEPGTPPPEPPEECRYFYEVREIAGPGRSTRQ